MKLVFRKDEKSEISVFRKVDGEEKDFSYVEMIKVLIDVGELEDPEIVGEFTEAEKNSISSMVSFINNQLQSSEEIEE